MKKTTALNGMLPTALAAQLALGAALFCAIAAPPPWDWQRESVTPGPKTETYAPGLNFAQKPPATIAIGGMLERVELVPAKGAHIPGLGFVTCAEPDFSDASASWVHGEATYGDKEAGKPYLRIAAGRLSPAIYLETTFDEITIFKTAFKMMALAEADGKIAIADLTRPSESDMALYSAPKWALFWAGKGAGFRLPRRLDCMAITERNVPRQEMDRPYLLVFGDWPLERIVGMPDEIRIKFEETRAEKADPPARMALLAFRGLNYQAAEETERWRSGLPEAVVKECEQWRELLGRYPLTATEDYKYSPEQDSAEVFGAITYEPLREEATACAPLPPMLGIAAEAGLPVEFDGQVLKTGYATAIGPCWFAAGADSYRWRLRGMDKYAHGAMSVPETETEPAALREELNREIDNILDADDFLAPAIWENQGYRGYAHDAHRPLFTRPSDMLNALFKTLPLLDAQRAQRVREYCRQYRAKFPPEEIFALKPWEGARRERYTLPEKCEAFEKINRECPALGYARAAYPAAFNVAMKRVPAESAYALATYYRLIEPELPDSVWTRIKEIFQPYFRHHDWATLGWFQWHADRDLVVSCTSAGGTAWNSAFVDFDGHGGVIDANRFFLAMLGYVRMARQAGDRDAERLGRAFLAKTAALRLGMEKYAAYVYPAVGVITPEDPAWMHNINKIICCQHKMPMAIPYLARWAGPEDDMRRILTLTEFSGREWPMPVGYAKFLGYSLFRPYSKPFMFPYVDLEPELGVFLRDFARPEVVRFVQGVEESKPDWHLYISQARLLMAEHCFPHPADSHQIFMAKALVEGAAPQELEYRLDVPWHARGDCYYLDKLIATIWAYRSAEWK